MLSIQAQTNAVPTDTSRPTESRRRARVHELQSQIVQFMDRMRIAVVFGGDKSIEGAVINPTANPRCWKSYQAVAEDIADALKRLGFRDVHMMPDDMRLGERLRRAGIHMAWLNTGGVQGYNPMAHASSMLEMFGIPYVGHDPLTTGMLDNKHVFKRELRALGIPTAPFAVSHASDGPLRPAESARFKEAFGGYAGPFVVKPVSGRASWHVYVADAVDQLGDITDTIHRATENHALVEAYLPGPEYCISACGYVTAHGGTLERHAEPFTLSAIERRLGPDEQIFTSMDVRPITAERLRVLDPVRDGREIDELGRLAREVYRELSLESIIRLDVRADSAGRLLVLEANPKPDLKQPSENHTNLACANLPAYGMSYDDLLLSLISDRIDLLFSQRRRTVTHLAALLEMP